MRTKKCEKNLSEKLRKKRFLYAHEYGNQKMGGKTRKTIFPETHQHSEQKSWEKNRHKKVRKNIF